MSERPEQGLWTARRRKLLAFAASVVLVVAGGTLLWQALSGEDKERPGSAATAVAPTAPIPVKEDGGDEGPEREAEPESTQPRVRLPPGRKPADGPTIARIIIPAIGVRAPMIKLGLNRDKSLQVPADVRETGWWAGGAVPGRKGAAVIVGHVDSRTGPAVFHDLPRLRNGDRVTVVPKRGRRATFEVTGRRRVPKDDFPTAEVYEDPPRPEIRLVTCTGQFDASEGHYRDNLIVYGRRV